ncbi:SDR family NAD(P)-dependent oxidoreductase [Klebsiella pneumoniae subsp. pneumoniae]|nr:SDR family NAD(P)-dependent oxidoreductase [Klebsiella pneumoniae subsp. pneumoniae]
MQRDFQNKTVVITGACRGIGAGIAERFARDGANLVMVSNAERVHQTAETLRQRLSGGYFIAAGRCHRRSPGAGAV